MDAQSLQMIIDLIGPAFYALLGFIVLSVVVQIVATWKIFEKAGQPGWASIIPIYSAIVMMKIVGRPAWYWLIPAVLMVVCGLGLIWVVILTNDLAKSFGKNVGFTIGLLFFPVVFLAILAFSKDSVYVGPAAAKKA